MTERNPYKFREEDHWGALDVGETAETAQGTTVSLAGYYPAAEDEFWRR